MPEFWGFSPCPPPGGQALRGLVHRSEDTVAHSGDTCELGNVRVGSRAGTPTSGTVPNTDPKSGHNRPVPRSRSTRVLRGASAATIATFVALVSHVSGGGEIPGPLGIAAPWILSVMVCTFLAGRVLSLARLSVAVVISQALFHVLFVLGMAPGAAGTTGHAHDRGAMLDTTLNTMATTMSVTTPGTTTALVADSTMWFAHALAAAITVAALYRGERALRRLHDLARHARTWFGRLVAVLDTPIPEHPSPAPARGQRVVLLHPLDHSASSLSRRGPPALPVI